MTKCLVTLLFVAASTSAFADGTQQNHHCKLPDGTFDGTKTNKQCTAAKGSWAKDIQYAGTLKTGINAPGGETTGITLDVSGTTYELDLHGDKALQKTADGANGASVTVTGYATVKTGVEVKKRDIIVVSTLKASATKAPTPTPPAPSPAPATPKKPA